MTVETDFIFSPKRIAVNSLRLPRPTGIYCILIGFLNLGMWTFLILTGKVPDLETHWISLLFHWLAEFTTALLLVFAGFRILSGKPGLRHLFFLAMGFLTAAIHGAFWYYLVNYSLPVFAICAGILLITIILFLVNLKGRHDLLWLAAGAILYTSLNLFGLALENKALSSLAHSSLLLLFVIILVLSQAKRESSGMKEQSP